MHITRVEKKNTHFSHKTFPCHILFLFIVKYNLWIFNSHKLFKKKRRKSKPCNSIIHKRNCLSFYIPKT